MLEREPSESFVSNFEQAHEVTLWRIESDHVLLSGFIPERYPIEVVIKHPLQGLYDFIPPGAIAKHSSGNVIQGRRRNNLPVSCSGGLIVVRQIS